MVSKRRQNPAFRYKNRRFHLGLVLWFADAGGNDNRAIMLSHLMIGRIDVRFVVAGSFNSRFKIVRNKDFRDAPKESKRPDIGLDPGRKVLSMIGIMEPPIFAVMEPVKRVAKGSSDPPFNQAL